MVLIRSFLVGLQISMSSTHCKMAPPCMCSSLRSFSNTPAKRWGLSLNPWGNTVQVHCWFIIVLRSVPSKASKYGESRCKGMQKKGSFKSNTEYHWVSSATCELLLDVKELPLHWLMLQCERWWTKTSRWSGWWDEKQKTQQHQAEEPRAGFFHHTYWAGKEWGQIAMHSKQKATVINRVHSQLVQAQVYT